MYHSVTVVMFTFLSLYLKKTEELPDHCNCLDCKTIIQGEFAGTYILSKNPSQQVLCNDGCFYEKEDTGRELCFCDPGNVTYEECHGSTSKIESTESTETTTKTTKTTTKTTKTTPSTTITTATSTTTTCSTNGSCGCNKIWLEKHQGKRANTRIVGGEDTTPEKWPWIVSLTLYKSVDFKYLHLLVEGGNIFEWRIGTYEYASQCGGSLITCKHVLTAGHCLKTSGDRTFMSSDKVQPNEDFTDGKYLLGTWSWVLTKIEVKMFTAIWNEGVEYLHDDPILCGEADVGIIPLTKEINKADKDRGIKPIMLPKRALTQNDDYYVIGYGFGLDPNVVNYQLHETDKLKLEAEAACTGMPASNPYQPTTDICIKNIGPPSNPISDCQGDSGSPGMIFDEDDDKWYIQGVVSRRAATTGSCVIGSPSVHVAVHKTPVLDWIYSNIYPYPY